MQIFYLRRERFELRKFGAYLKRLLDFHRWFFLTSEKRITVYWEIIIACLLSHGICLVFLFSYFFLIAYIKNGQSFLKCVRSPINSKACLSWWFMVNLILYQYSDTPRCWTLSAFCASNWWTWSSAVCWTVGNLWSYTAWKGYIWTWKCWLCDFWCASTYGGTQQSIMLRFTPSIMLKYWKLDLSSVIVQTQVVNDETWKLIDDIWEKRVQEIRAEASAEVEEDKEKPQLLMASHFLWM